MIFQQAHRNHLGRQKKELGKEKILLIFSAIEWSVSVDADHEILIGAEFLLEADKLNRADPFYVNFSSDEKASVSANPLPGVYEININIRYVSWIFIDDCNL